MNDRRSHREMTDGGLEQFILGLPRREPSAALRACVLGPASSAARRPLSARTSVAAAVCVLLLVVQALIVRVQDARLSVSPAAGAAVTVQARPAVSSDAWLGEDLGGHTLVLGIAPGLVEERADGASYLRLRDELLQNELGS